MGQYGYRGFSDLVVQMSEYYPSLRRLTFVTGAAHRINRPHLVSRKWESYLGDINFEFPSLDYKGQSPVLLSQRLEFWRDYESQGHMILDQEMFEQAWRRRDEGMLGEPPKMPEIDFQVMIAKEYEDEFDRQVEAYLNEKR